MMRDEFNKQKERKLAINKTPDKSSDKSLSNESSSYRSVNNSDIYHDIEEATKVLPNKQNNDNEINAAANTCWNQNHNAESSTNDASGDSDKLWKDVERVLQQCENSSQILSAQNDNCKMYKSKVASLNDYLKNYFELFKSSKSVLEQVRSQKQAELNSITKVFDKCRQEIDLKEKLVKLEFSTIVSNWEDALIEDIKHLSDKCTVLCKKLTMLTKCRTITTSSDNTDSTYSNLSAQNDAQIKLSLAELDNLLVIENIDGPRMKQMTSFSKKSLWLGLPSLSYDLQNFRTSLYSIKMVKNDAYEASGMNGFRPELNSNQQAQSISVDQLKSAYLNNSW